MSDEQNRRVQARMEQELAELADPRVQFQQILDRWREQCQAAAEEEERRRRYLDPFGPP